MNPSPTTFYEGPSANDGDGSIRFRYYTQQIDNQLAAGLVADVMLVIDQSPTKVWSILKDFNAWQNQCDHYYSGVIGDLEGKTFRLSSKPNDEGPHQYKVVRVIPEHLIVTDQPGPWDGGPKPYDGYAVFMLNERDGRTVVTITMQHSVRSQERTPERALECWRQMEPQLLGKWRDSFIPTLTKLACDEAIR